MKFYKLILIILIVFLKTGNVLSDNYIFNVNNIEIEKTNKASNETLANQAIKRGFKDLVSRIILNEDSKKLNGLKLSEIKDLVTYYQISNKTSNNDKKEKVNFNISFDKDKMHNLFYEKGISYSEITNKEIFILPILKKNNQIYIYSQNFFYDNWNNIYDTEIIEFILPLENIEIIQNIRLNKNSLLNLELNNLFTEYSKKNIALVLIEDSNVNEEKIYFKTKILGKVIVKNINIKRSNLSENDFYSKIIVETKKEIINLIKSQNLIDIRVPSFLKAEFKINKKNNLVELKSKLQKIDLIENIFIQNFNNKIVFLRIKYLGKLNNIIRQLKENEIILKLTNEKWIIEII